MGCPEEIARILLEILRVGLLRIRALGWDHNPSRCAAEADHLHNLPMIITSYSPDSLQAYWTSARATLLDSGYKDFADFERLWERLAPHLPPSI
jgi:hypothetical protein